MQRIAIFKTGKHTDTNGQTIHATAQWVRDVVNGYQPSKHESPAVIGHPKDNLPAYGWVKSLSFDEGSGVMYADLNQVEPQFKQMLKDGRFKKRSASFYPPNHPSNPTKGKPYLRHVGFLGAQAPAIKGLADFSEDADCVTYEFTEINPKPKDTSMPQHSDDVTQVMDFAEREAQLLAREQAVLEREQQLEQQNQQGFYDFTDTLIQAGKITPAERQSIVDVLIDIDDSDHTYNFSENGTTVERTSADALKTVLQRLNPIIDFAERTATNPNEADTPQHINLSESSETQLAKNIQAFANKHNLSYADAVQQYNGEI